MNYVDNVVGMRAFALGEWANGSSIRINLLTWPCTLPKDAPAALELYFGASDSFFSFGDNTGDDTRRLRRYWSGKSVSSANPNVLAALIVNPYITSTIGLTQQDVGGTMLSGQFSHPAYTGVITLAAGQPYITSSNFNSVLVSSMHQDGSAILRIEGGPDAGSYVICAWDSKNSRAYLRRMDGTLFSATSSTSTQAASLCIRNAVFNEAGAIPNGTGSVDFGGEYDGTKRANYAVKLILEKSGNCDGDYKGGSYWFALQPYLYGVTNQGNADAQTLRHDSGKMAARQKNGCAGLAIDEARDLFWVATNDNSSTGDICWKFRLFPDKFHEVANTSNDAAEAIPTINMAGGLPRDLLLDKDGNVYCAIAGGSNAGVVRIAADRASATQGRVTGWSGTTANINGLCLDSSRDRVGAAGDVSTKASGDDQITTASGDFSAADVGRVLKIAGASVSGDDGLYLIATVDSSTQVTLTALDGSAVTFAGSTGATYEIGERIYVFWNDATTNVGALHYLETLAPVTSLFSVAVTMTNGVTLNNANNNYQTPKAVDQETGVLYWGSSDTRQQLNRYDPALGAVTNRPLSDFNGLNGGAGTAANPTQIYALIVNNYLDADGAFRELWVGTNAGHVRLDPDDFTGSFARYVGANATYTVGGFPKDDGAKNVSGGTQTASGIRDYCVAADGAVYACAAYPDTQHEMVRYNREQDTWIAAVITASGFGPTNSTEGVRIAISADGHGVYCAQTTSGAPSYTAEFSVATHFQWIGGAWVPKEVVRRGMPDALGSPGCSARPLHTTEEDLIYGLTVKFTPQGGATPPNAEFLGRLGQTAAQRTDGGTTASSATFAGSSFTAADTGRLLRIESGASSGGIYKMTYVDANHVTLKTLAGAAFSGAATATSLSYTVWENQNNPGPEHTTVVMAHGLVADNTTSINNIGFDFFWSGTVRYDQSEDIKHAVSAHDLGVLGVSSQAVKLYFSQYVNSYTSGVPACVALPASATAGLERAVSGSEFYANGGGGRPSAAFTGTWGGRKGNASAGAFVDVDFGADAEIGFVQLSVVANLEAFFANAAGSQPGACCNLYVAPDAAGAPAASSVARTSGTGNLNITAGNTTITLTSGDFLGTAGDSGTAGTTTLDTNTFGEAAGTFDDTHVGQVLKITSGAASGSYRIIGVAPDGSSCSIENLDMTAKQFLATASGLAWTIYDAVREQDMIVVGAHSLGVERLISTTAAQVRFTPSATLTAQNWTCYKPTWNLVKRVAQACGVPLPERDDNNTYRSTYRFYSSTQGVIAFDLSDLATAQRKGRYWRFALSPLEFSYSGGAPTICSLDFFAPDGTPLGTFSYNQLDGVGENADFFSCFVSRLDWIQAANGDVGGSYNGLADVSSSRSVGTATLAGGNAFMGRTVRSVTAYMTANDDSLHVYAPEGFVSSDVGRFVTIASGSNAGIYRIAGVVSATEATVVTPNAAAVLWAATEPSVACDIHEGISTGDYIAFPDPSNGPEVVDYEITALTDDLTTLTLAHCREALSGKKWEIRRRGLESKATAVDATYSARILYGNLAAPLQPGDVCQHVDGRLEFYGDDVMSRPAFTDGASTSGSGDFDAADMAPTVDDVGRLLRITSGADAGVYRILGVSGTMLSLGTAKDGTAVTLTDTASTLGYQILGDRRYRASRYVIVLQG